MTAPAADGGGTSLSRHPRMALPPPGSLPPAPVRWLLYGMAMVCLVLAAIGVVVPGMPSTVFVILAAWAAARSCWLTWPKSSPPS